MGKLYHVNLKCKTFRVAIKISIKWYSRQKVLPGKGMSHNDKKDNNTL